MRNKGLTNERKVKSASSTSVQRIFLLQEGNVSNSDHNFKVIFLK